MMIQRKSTLEFALQSSGHMRMSFPVFFTKKETKKKRPKKRENEDFFFSFSSFKDRKGLE
jgi:hypothetical protein